MIDIIEAWLRLAATRLHEQASALTALDQAIGDGDHGTNMDRGFSADRGLPRRRTGPRATMSCAVAAAVLRGAGRTLISTVGGAAGPLYGTAFMRAGGSLVAADAWASSTELALTALEAGIVGIGGLGKARPARRRCSTRSSRQQPRGARRSTRAPVGADVAGAVAAAAEEGATSTIPMLATKGRASYLGERSIGHQDPGATSSALLLRALADVASAR